MVLLDVSIVNVALPSIRSGLHASESDLQWVVSGYALTFGLLLVPAGRYGDLRGRRLVFVFSLGLFSLASAACGAATTSGWLVAARLAQGLAAGALIPQVSALIQEMFAGRERGQAFGRYGTVIGFSTAIGPALGGVLIELFGDVNGWRLVFFVNVPIGVIAIPFALRLLPSPAGNRSNQHHNFDPMGVALLGIGVVLLMLPFIQGRQWGKHVWLLLPLAAVTFGLFALWERRYTNGGKEPFVDFTLFRLRSYSFGITMITFYFAGFTPLFFVLTLFLQQGQRYPALLAGLSILPFAVGTIATAAFGGRNAHRYGRRLVAIGLSLVILGLAGSMLAIHLLPHQGTAIATIIPLLMAGMGSGLVISPNQTLTLSRVPVAHAGTAAGLLQSGQRLGAAIGIATVGSVYFGAAVSGTDDYPSAYESSIGVAIAFITTALLITITEIALHRRDGSQPMLE